LHILWQLKASVIDRAEESTAFAGQVRSHGPEHHEDHHTHSDPEDEWKGQLLAAVLCGGFALAGAILHDNPWSILFFLLAYASGVFFLILEVWEHLREGVLDVHFLMFAVALGSASIGAWGEGSTLLFLFSISTALEHYAMGRTQREIRALYKEAPKTAIALDDSGREHRVPVETLQPGQFLLIKPGDQFPCDGEVFKGTTAADESNLTGESAPVEKTTGDTVFAGTINLWGSITLQVTRPPSESALEKIIRLIERAQHLRAPAQRFTDKFGNKYTWLILLFSVTMFFVWWLAVGLEPFAGTNGQRTAFYRTMTLLVVSSPCALVLSIPSAVLAAIAFAARRGILFRGGAAVENLGKVEVVAMDKTGTLTTGELRIGSIESFPPGREEEIAQLAFSLERLSTHPLARAISRHARQRGLKSFAVEGFESISGCGLRGRIQGEDVYLGKKEWVRSANGSDHQCDLPRHPGLSEVWISSGELLGRVILRDEIRPEAKKLIDDLRSRGLTTIVLTGDRQSAGQQLRDLIGPDEIHAELTPEQKVQTIRQLSKDGRFVAMIGDGVNDAPSLAAAHIGVAMGARGSDAALEQADVVLMNDRLENFLSAYKLSQRARRVIQQNIAISLGTVVVLMIFALLGSIPLTVGVVGHEGSTVIVVLNSLRLLLTRNR
jgi:Zn2+/Cd2+-exporting ATPase